MRRLPFEPPIKHYDQRIEAIDEHICNLINQRKDITNNNPGFPTKKLITTWSEKYNLYEEFLNSVFTSFLNEDMYKPVVEPKGFLKNIPILKSFEKDDVFYSVTFVRQYENASVVHFNIDREDSDDEVPRRIREPILFDLSIEGKEADFNCRNEGGGGSGGHESYTFIVSPALPDDLSEIKLVFKKYKPPFFNKPTGVEFVI
ncbi:hypothetical protein [Neobacillus rhizophilus]|uniref:Uncharacterized protein n=1 Tax=Neobacillus rhizophilus TaxID=2833579 RepID=A0A942YVK9_9BACI|nr:hypothetical protein [Neobacillus rhizophilus]MBS4214047.1 hypothetical protein [Neobacillus rhizophilus]MBU8917551.1 hypothetical protein [Bacillus sp. FJAT-29953]